ncbi:MAG: sugar phosphate isomerase/epimerase [Clostridia bacterium]|nr:sugar phosphate isomerase/epimerase [Clostridia bacterium]
MELNYGLQLFSISDFTAADLDYALANVAEYGYKTVEFAGFCGHTADEIDAMLKKYKLGVIGEHVGMDLLDEEHINSTLASSEAIGNKNIVFPSLALSDANEVAAALKNIERIKKETDKRGMKLHFHTHDWDYRPNEDGLIPIEIIEKETDILFEIDTFWAFYAGRDPVKEMERLRHRCELVHIKDGKANRDPAVVGEGVAPVIECVEKADELGIYKIVESEGMIPDGLTDVRHCLKYLRKVANGEITR